MLHVCADGVVLPVARSWQVAALLVAGLGADVNARNSGGQTALHYAVSCGRAHSS